MSSPSVEATAAPTTSRPPLVRDPRNRMVAGVAAAVASHLRVPVQLVRALFVVATFLGGSGLVAYAMLWALVPQRPVSGEELQTPEQGRSPRTVVVSLGVLGLGLLLLAELQGWGINGSWQIVAIGIGAALVWLRVDDEQRARLLAGVEHRPGGMAGLLQLAVGVVLVISGGLALVAGQGGWDQFVSVATAAVVAILGLGLLVSPYVIRNFRERESERRERIRSQERAELAARIHDSVLQTLSLVQRNASNPREVARLARAQERDLRRVLYEAPVTVTSSFRAALQQVAADVEDSHGLAVEVVCVGDATVDELLHSLLLAVRETVINAAKHSQTQSPIAVYAEVTATSAVVYVKDRGVGFDVDAVPRDRLGLRESVVGRLERMRGTADIRSSTQGTEVSLRLPRPFASLEPKP